LRIVFQQGRYGSAKGDQVEDHKAEGNRAAHFGV
jgi:hypothetical protein